jgi:DNA-binding LacI/PurR family transcriptional regulator
MRSGFYMGEISSTLRAYGAEQGINLIFLRVGQSRDFDIPFAFDHIDGLIVVLRAAASTLVEKTVQKGIPVISVAANYAPLTVESLSSDQASGVNALYDHLTALGHVDIGFCGDLSVNDVRIRFKAFQRRAEHFGNTITKRHIINASNTALQGGREAYERSPAELHETLYSQGQSGFASIMNASCLFDTPE